jgi:hypothetical protein
VGCRLGWSVGGPSPTDSVRPSACQSTAGDG